MIAQHEPFSDRLVGPVMLVVLKCCRALLVIYGASTVDNRALRKQKGDGL